MARLGGNTAKLVSDDALLYESALKRRTMIRLLFGVSLILVAVLLVTAAFIPIIAKSTIPLLWIDYANSHGWTKEMQEIGMRLIANGRIEIYPLWMSYIAMTIGMVVGWFAAHMIRTRKENTILGDLLTRGYWLHFYWLKKPGGSLMINYRSLKKK